MTKRQREIMDNKQFDQSVGKQVNLMIEKLTDDLGVDTAERKVDHGAYVDRYGKENSGFISFSEFKEIYLNHVFFSDTRNMNREPPEENLIRALFNTIDADQRHRISRDQFAKFIKNKAPAATFFERLRQKARRGGHRFALVLE